jgi:hypothetical protein
VSLHVHQPPGIAREQQQPAFALAVVPAARAELKLPAIIGDHMVLQQKQANPIWGWDTPGTRVTVKFSGQSYTATAGSDGRWTVKLAAAPANATPQVLSIAGTTQRNITDVLIGASGTYVGGVARGAAYVVAGPVYGVLDLGVSTLILQGSATGEELGEEVAAGDLDGDGLDELVVAGDGVSTTAPGVAYIVESGLTGTQTITTAATSVLTGAASADHLGSGLAIPGDMNGDGTDDLALGVRAYNRGTSADVGVVYIFTSLPASTTARSPGWMAWRWIRRCAAEPSITPGKSLLRNTAGCS